MNASREKLLEVPIRSDNQKNEWMKTEEKERKTKQNKIIDVKWKNNE